MGEEEIERVGEEEIERVGEEECETDGEREGRGRERDGGEETE